MNCAPKKLIQGRTTPCPLWDIRTGLPKATKRSSAAFTAGGGNVIPDPFQSFCENTQKADWIHLSGKDFTHFSTVILTETYLLEQPFTQIWLWTISQRADHCIPMPWSGWHMSFTWKPKTDVAGCVCIFAYLVSFKLSFASSNIWIDVKKSQEQVKSAKLLIKLGKQINLSLWLPTDTFLGLVQMKPRSYKSSASYQPGLSQFLAYSSLALSKRWNWIVEDALGSLSALLLIADTVH